MSIKIYNAYKFNGSMTHLWKILNNLKDDIKKAEEKEIFFKEINESIFEIDYAKFFKHQLNPKESIDNYPINTSSTYIGTKFEDYNIGNQKKHPSVLDKTSSFTVSIFPLSNRKILLLFFPSLDFHYKILQTYLSNFEEYSYQNSTDKPKNISTRKWNQRLNDWKKANILNDTPINVGLNFRLGNENISYFNSSYVINDFLSKNNISNKKRIDTLLNNFVDSKAFSKVQKKNKLKWNECWRLLNPEYNEYKEYHAEIAKIKNSKSFQNLKQRVINFINKNPIDRKFLTIKVKDLTHH